MKTKNHELFCSDCSREIQIVDNVIHGGLCVSCWIKMMREHSDIRNVRRRKFEKVMERMKK